VNTVAQSCRGDSRAGLGPRQQRARSDRAGFSACRSRRGPDSARRSQPAADYEVAIPGGGPILVRNSVDLDQPVPAEVADTISNGFKARLRRLVILKISMCSQLIGSEGIAAPGQNGPAGLIFVPTTAKSWFDQSSASPPHDVVRDEQFHAPSQTTSSSCRDCSSYRDRRTS